MTPNRGRLDSSWSARCSGRSIRGGHAACSTRGGHAAPAMRQRVSREDKIYGKLLLSQFSGIPGDNDAMDTGKKALRYWTPARRLSGTLERCSPWSLGRVKSRSLGPGTHFREGRPPRNRAGSARLDRLFALCGVVAPSW